MEHLELIRKAKTGDPESFEKLLSLYGDRLYRTAFLYAGNREDALDIIQETVCKAFLAIGNLKEEKYFSTWLTRILLNAAYEFLRKRKRDIPFASVEKFSDGTESIRMESLDLVRAIQRLRKSYRDAIILFYYQDLPIKEVAKIMQVPEGTVKTYLRRGKEELKSILEGWEFDERRMAPGKI
ncbi:sigma-70 family RNA polymerase sigma factor [Caldibacillus debilis]|jgi:RNA polymerase sigma-70 factor (ECF subfamily)|uniref:RNA polymerase, sigma subunit, SigV n=1 Tax=Caldibacillus debilis GB1 TaxID=1339248 RepID=A0A420VGW7_9BACI|nr:sigma-70 family RNA polymerase sigma factor [Caldibacillus debilis]RKO62932.1 RNA polymerase, sigma subunit, SigV [Caldibacillus debilis GB1]